MGNGYCVKVGVVVERKGRNRKVSYVRLWSPIPRVGGNDGNRSSFVSRGESFCRAQGSLFGPSEQRARRTAGLKAYDPGALWIGSG
jgi:hypothetical protein